MTDVVEFVETTVDYHRDRWGRPLIVPADGGKPIPYTRSSSATKAIEDTYNLELWSRRNTAFGIAHDQSLTARVLAVGGDPSSWSTDAKREVNKVCEDAANIAQAHKAADIGTALHRMVQRTLLDETVEAGIYSDDLAAFTTAVDQMGWTVDPDYVEVRLVADELTLAGTCDMVVGEGRRHRVADLKTGRTVEYGGLSYSGQLAGYAHSQRYDVAEGRRLPTVRIDAEIGYIIHLPAGEGRCTIYTVDLVEGLRACRLAADVRSIRRQSRGFITEWTPETITEAQRAEWANPDEGDDVDLGDLEVRYRALPPDARAWIGHLTVEAQRAGVPFHLKGTHTARRRALVGALVRMGAHPDFDAEFATDSLREMLSAVLGTESAAWPTIEAGYALGACGHQQAAQLVDMVDAGWPT